jgi:hypothetical protein
MPLKKARKGASKKARQKLASKNISEFSHGSTFARTKRKFGAAKARKQAIAVGLATAGLSRRRKRKR